MRLYDNLKELGFTYYNDEVVVIDLGEEAANV